MIHPVHAFQPLGKGRSGVVFRGRDSAGREVARKVFAADDTMAKIVHYAFTGAPNPYTWNEDAIRCAVLRRIIIEDLLRFWFGSKLRLARAYDHRWSHQHQAFEMDCQFIDGRPVILHSPFTAASNAQLPDVVEGVMQPLQEHLMEAGFDGLLWQAGLGNPVALNNFLCEGPDGAEGYRWAWIDLESGVPALFPINPRVLFDFYLPKSFEHRRPLFDDVDTDKLRHYIRGRRLGIVNHIGEERFTALQQAIEDLGEAQDRWKALSRVRRSIGYRLSRGGISTRQAQYYALRPVRWYTREAARAVGPALRAVGRGAARLWDKIRGIPLRRVFIIAWSAILSETYRTNLAKEYVTLRVNRWHDRRQLTDEQVADLREHLEVEEATSYLPDFGVHLAIKPVLKITQYALLPLLWAAGLINEWHVGLYILFAGAAARSLYTGYRFAENTRRGQEKPWVALVVGVLPSVGNLAFPAQIIATSSHTQAHVAQFILYDTFSSFGRFLPIWGGQDTLTEHFFNRLPTYFIRRPEEESTTAAA